MLALHPSLPVLPPPPPPPPSSTATKTNTTTTTTPHIRFIIRPSSPPGFCGSETTLLRPKNVSECSGDKEKESSSPLVVVAVEKEEEKNSNDEKDKKEEKERRVVSFCMALTEEEIEADIVGMTGGKPLKRRPKKRKRDVKKNLDNCFPGLNLHTITPARYKLRRPK
ncbi:hypothetical protein Tsubulata_047185 [Turnera subulata]|uniref:Uncharacterized protein n=1 Tax=Turnera subulata TaxID=218843 RepID=A0A9Q0JQY9_9ROSI|nr:hypothetical protein Tsubulata_047185 [Turnera subulata]